MKSIPIAGLYSSTGSGHSVTAGRGVHGVGAGRYVVDTNAEDIFTEYESYNIRGWDGYDADPISSRTVETARSLNRLIPLTVRNPDVAPGPDGTIGFEWR